MFWGLAHCLTFLSASSGIEMFLVLFFNELEQNKLSMVCVSALKSQEKLEDTKTNVLLFYFLRRCIPIYL